VLEEGEVGAPDTRVHYIPGMDNITGLSVGREHQPSLVRAGVASLRESGDA
jgi:hypothetical protein